jgi:hypothetical protein
MSDKEKLENTIMGKIKTGQVKLKSRYIFIAEKLGLGTVFTFSVILSILFFNLILFYLKETDNLKYLSFGKFGVFAFLESFPYLLVTAFIIFIALAGYLITKSDVSYKKPFGYLAVGLVLFIMIFGAISTYTDIAQTIERQARTGFGPAKMLFQPLTDVRDKGVAGVVFEQAEDYLTIQTPQGLRNIDIKDAQDLPEIKKGDFIVAVGERNGFDFKVNKIKIADKNDMPSINRGIDMKFKEDRGGQKAPPMFFSEEEKNCVKKCFDNDEKIKSCFKKCHE